MSSVFTPATFMAQVRGSVQQARRFRWLPEVFLGVVALVAVVAFLVGRVTAPGLPDRQGPPNLTLPAHASLVRWEEYPADHEAIWYYAVPNSSQTAVLSFFKNQMAHGNWSCVASDFTSTINRNGQAFTGSNGYVAAKSGMLDVQINTGDQSFGAFLLQHDLDDHAIAIKIDVTTMSKPACGGA